MRHVRIDSAKEPKGFFQKRDPWGHGLALWILALILFVAPLSVSSLRHVRLDNDVESWLPEKDPSAADYLWCREHFPEDETVILTWEGSVVNDPRLPILVGKLTGKEDADGEMRGGLPYVKSVLHAGDLVERMVEFGIDQKTAIDRLQGTLVGLGRLKVRLTEAGREDLSRSQEVIVSGAKSIFNIDLEVQEPIGHWEPNENDEAEFHRLSDIYAMHAESDLESTDLGGHDFQITWKGMASHHELRDAVSDWIQSVTSPSGEPLVEECYRAVGSPIAVVVALSDAGRAEKNAAIAAIRQAALGSFVPETDLIVSGRVVAGTELNNGVIQAAWNPAATNPLKKSVILLSGFVGIVFALISLKSLRLGALVIFVAYYAALLGMSMVPLTGGSMNMVLIVMPTLLMVLALSGAIHVANYWKHAVWENPKTAVAEATRMASQPCLMAAFTTSLGLVSLMNSDLVPVRNFGLYASIGCMISVCMVLYGLPALLQMVPLKRVEPSEVNPARWIWFGNLICRQWLPIGTVTLVVAVACTIGLRYFDVETKVIKYFPESSQVVQDYQLIEDTLAGISPIEVLVRFNAQGQEDFGFLERLEIVRKVESSLHEHPEVSGTLSLASFQPVRKKPGDDASVREKIFFNRRSNQTERRVKSGDMQQAANFLTMNRLPQENGDELWRINAQAAVLTDADYTALTQELSDRVEEVIHAEPNIDHVVTGTVPLFLRTQNAVLESLIWSSLLAFGMIAAVMVWVLRDPFAGLISMIPNLLPVVAVFGLVSWFGQRIDIGTMVTASVAMGIAVDGTLHLLTWFKDGLQRGKTRQESVINALSHCGPAMWQTSAAVGVGLLVLFPAELLLISRFGWLMATLIGAAFIGDMVLLPCMLVGPLGILLERRLRKDPPSADCDSQDEHEPEAIPSHHLPLSPQHAHDSRYVG
ncbi:MMPL family protein [Thalassoglobus neptunius]|uniref:MMPL family protein n=1 Tax=Thalassoglobus neptunius TaxID=1938619 RepID=A0A5C5WGU8_9PLAN|nr:MMPL family transporter [Thalassoglobus neptunius]TWT50006.1 MMPL family protein [Thalassoglobus neptunius]